MLPSMLLTTPLRIRGDGAHACSSAGAAGIAEQVGRCQAMMVTKLFGQPSGIFALAERIAAKHAKDRSQFFELDAERLAMPRNWASRRFRRSGRLGDDGDVHRHHALLGERVIPPVNRYRQ